MEFFNWRLKRWHHSFHFTECENYPRFNVCDGKIFWAQFMYVSGISFTALSSVLEEYHMWLLIILTLLFCHFLFWFQDISQSIMDDLLKEWRWILVLYKNSFCSIQTFMEELPIAARSVESTSMLFLDWLRQVIHQNVGIGENFWMKKCYRSTNLSAFSYLQLCRHVWLVWSMTDASHTWRHRWWPWGPRTKNCISFKSSYQDRHFGISLVSISPKTTKMWP